MNTDSKIIVYVGMSCPRTGDWLFPDGSIRKAFNEQNGFGNQRIEKRDFNCQLCSDIFSKSRSNMGQIISQYTWHIL